MGDGTTAGARRLGVRVRRPRSAMPAADDQPGSRPAAGTAARTRCDAALPRQQPKTGAVLCRAGAARHGYIAMTPQAENWVAFWDNPHSIYVNAQHVDAHYR